MNNEIAQTDRNSSGSRARLWTGRFLSGLAALLFALDGGMKLVKPPEVVKATLQMGYPESAITGIGLALLFCTLLYVVPRTSFLGSILLTGYLGGAVASHVRLGAGWFNILFPVLFGALVWAGLWLRNPRLQSFLADQLFPGKATGVSRALTGTVLAENLLN